MFDTLVEKLEVTKEELLNDSFKFFDYDLVGNGIDNDKELCLHSMSPIFDRIIELMKAKINKDSAGEEDYTEYDLPKFLMFSAHDSTCAAFMGFMKEVFGTPIRYPYFATNINLELNRKNKTEGKYNENDFSVEYIINDESMLNISFTEFVSKVKEKRKTAEEISKFCGFDEQEEKKENGNKEEGDGDTNVYLIVNIILSIISVILIVLLIITIKKKKNNNNVEDLGSIEKLTNMNEGEGEV